MGMATRSHISTTCAVSPPRSPSGKQECQERVRRCGPVDVVEDWNGNTTIFGYDANSNLTGEMLPANTGVADTFGFNAADQMTSISDVKGSATLFAATYTRDAANQMTSDTSATTNQGAYKYTPLNQVCYGGSANTTACSSPPSGAQPFPTTQQTI